MKNKSLITKVVIILLSIIIFLILFYFIKWIIASNNKDQPDEVIPEIQEYVNNTQGKIQKVYTAIDLYEVKSCILKYYSNYSAIFSENSISEVLGDEYDRDDYKKAVYNMLSPKYIQKKGITLENIDSNRENYISEPEIEIYYLYCCYKNDGAIAYFVNGKIRDAVSNEAQDLNLIIVLDDNNKTFEIYLNDFLDINDFSKLEENQNINFEVPSNVENREYNTYGTVSAKYEDIAMDKFNNIRTLMLYDQEKAYDLLTDEIKNARFKTLDDFVEFINTNRRTIFLLSYGNYYLKNNNGSVIFKAYDQNNTICLNIYFDGFTSFKFDLEGI